MKTQMSSVRFNSLITSYLLGCVEPPCCIGLIHRSGAAASGDVWGARPSAASWRRHHSEWMDITKPRVARNELPWVNRLIHFYPERVASAPPHSLGGTRGIRPVHGLVPVLDLWQDHLLMPLDSSNLSPQSGTATSPQHSEESNARMIEEIPTEELSKPSCCVSSPARRALVGRMDYEGEKALDAALQ